MSKPPKALLRPPIEHQPELIKKWWTQHHKPWTHGTRMISYAFLGTIGIGTGIGYTLHHMPLPSLLVAPSQILSQDGQVIGQLSDQSARVEVPLSDIPLALQEATIAVEDASFYHHRGLNFKGIGRALLADLSARHIVQGGSTITQQLAKNLFLSSDRTLWRKLQEALYAVDLEWHYSKQKILTDYLNVIYYGDGATGVEAAAELYFGKSVTQLDLAQCTLLAGLPKGPSIYSPFIDEVAAKERQKQVLQAMVRAGYLTQRAAHAAFIAPLHFAHRTHEQVFAPYFMDAAATAAQDTLHVQKGAFYRGGLSIRSTLDIQLQKALDQAISHDMPATSGLQVAAIVMDPTTGAIKAYTGGKNYTESPYDRVHAMRQPGSVFKPFVYTAALDNGYTVAMHMKSAPTTFHYDGTRAYTVHNFADDYSYGQIDMKQAIAHSDNIFAVSTNLHVGPKRVIDVANRFDLPDNMHPYPSLALGVFPVSAYELARAYAVFANGGYLVQPHYFTAITDPTGHYLARATPSKLLVESPATCYIMTDMLQSVMQPGGTGYRVKHMIPGTVAAKTGTTDTDAWIVGYTPHTVCAVWVGYDHMRPINSVESHIAAPIFASVMKAAFAENPQGSFIQPTGVSKVGIDPQTGQRATSQCPIVEQDFFAAHTEPLSSCMLHPEPTIGIGQRMQQMIQSFWHLIGR